MELNGSQWLELHVAADRTFKRRRIAYGVQFVKFLCQGKIEYQEINI
jgi:hypothetical protein